MESNFKIKILLTGATASKKSDVLNDFIKSKFSTNYKLTVGVDIMTKDVEFKPGELATLTIWDIGGQHEFDFVRSTFYKGASGVLVVFDLTREETYEEIKNWLTEIRKFTEKDIPFVLMGNKADLIEKAGAVLDREKARELAEDEGMIYIETTTRTGELDKLEEAFTELTRKIIGKKEKESARERPEKEKKDFPQKITNKEKKESPQKRSEKKKKVLTL